MERKVFSDPDIAPFMNSHFVSINVEHEERPDVDEIYMRFMHLLNDTSGWPNSVFLTPDAKPFNAGTYFQPAEGYGRLGFPRLLRRLDEAWQNEREEVLAAPWRVAERIGQLALRFQASDSSRCLPPHRAILTLDTSAVGAP